MDEIQKSKNTESLYEILIKHIEFNKSWIEAKAAALLRERKLYAKSKS